VHVILVEKQVVGVVYIWNSKKALGQVSNMEGPEIHAMNHVGAKRSKFDQNF